MQTFAVCNSCGQMNRVEIGSDKAPICGKCKATLPIHGAIIEGRDDSTKKLITKSPLPVIIDIWAPWCGPCRSFAPTFESTSQQFAGKGVFVKLNSDENQQMPSEWGIRGIPTLIAFKDGKEIARQSGAIPQDHFIQWLQQLI